MSRYILAHVHDRPGEPWERSDPHEEIHVLPFGSKVAVAVPLGALGRALPVIAAGSVDVPDACCPGCGASLPAPLEE